MSDIINQNTEPLFIFDMPDDETLSETISVKGEKGERGDPTKLSDLENDEGFISADTDALTNYYDKATTDNKLDGKLDKTTFNAYEIPSDFFTGAETASGSGSSVLIANTSEALLKSIVIKGNTVQSATPTPASPVDVGVVTGTQVITIAGDGTQTYQIELGDIELCKVGSYQDYIYRANGSWVLHKETASVTFDGSEDWRIYNNVLQLYAITDYAITGNTPVSDHFAGASNVSGLSAVPDKSICFNQTSGATTPRFYLKDTSLFMSVSDLQTWLSENPTKVYYALETATETVISDATLTTQLDALARANSYNGETNIIVSGNTPAILDVEAFKNGWSGTVSGLDNDIDELRNRAATETTLGLVKVGDGLTVSGGELSVEPTQKMLFHSVAASSATYIVEFPNGKNMLIDTGTPSQWSDIQAAVNGLGVTKFDYAIVTHFHTDHTGNIQNFISNYDMSGCQWFVQMKPDYTNHAADVGDTEASYNQIINLLTSNGFTPIVPENDSYLEIDQKNKIKIRFLNTDATIAENYYGRYRESVTDGDKINFNDFSLIAEIIHNEVKILATGDIERPVEEQYTDYLGKVNILTIPHHGANSDPARGFYYAIQPDYAIQSLDVDNTSVTATSYMADLWLLHEMNAKIVSRNFSIPSNGLFTFVSNGTTVTTNALGTWETDSFFNWGSRYLGLYNLVRRTYETKAEITLEQMLTNLPDGHEVKAVWRSDHSTTFTQVLSDLNTIFPVFNIGMHIEFVSQPLFYEVNIYDEKISFNAKIDKSFTNGWLVHGRGELGAIASKTDLLTLLARLPFGHYTSNSYKETDSAVLSSQFQYILDINITNKSSTATVGTIMATAKDLAAHSASYVTNAISYYQSNSSPYIYWRGISITNTL